MRFSNGIAVFLGAIIFGLPWNLFWAGPFGLSIFALGAAATFSTDLMAGGRRLLARLIAILSMILGLYLVTIFAVSAPSEFEPL